jgi:hypothetical protein
MTAVVEIHVDRLVGVISIPVQAVVQVQKQTWCYVDQQGTPVRRPLKLGRSNDKFVEILEGLAESERVVLNPMAIFDESEQSNSSTDDQNNGTPESASPENGTPPLAPPESRPVAADSPANGPGRESPAGENGSGSRRSPGGPGRSPRPDGPRNETPRGN